MNWRILVVYIVVGFGILSAYPRYLLAQRRPPKKKEVSPRAELVALFVYIILGIAFIFFFLTAGVDALTIICSTVCVVACTIGVLLSYERYKWRRSVLAGEQVGPYPEIRRNRKS